MKDITVLLYVLLSLLSLLLLMEGYSLFRMREMSFRRRRRWMRIKVPNDKAITCRILEPIREAGTSEYLVDDITMAGICFYADRRVDRQIVKLSIKFPFTTFKDAATVWGKVVYSTKCSDGERYRTGISYLRRLSGQVSRQKAQAY
jgi:hypothetical protein